MGLYTLAQGNSNMDQLQVSSGADVHGKGQQGISQAHIGVRWADVGDARG